MQKHTLVLLATTVLLLVTKAQECLDLNYATKGTFYAGSSLPDTLALGGFYHSPNAPRLLSPEVAGLSREGSLQMIARTDKRAVYKDQIGGFKVFLVNRSDTTLALTALDSRIAIIRQVYFRNRWWNLEFLPYYSDCGNSRHTVYIRKNEYWEFIAPCIQGKKEANFRFLLFLNDQCIITSNEFSGSFNKKQLHRIQKGYKEYLKFLN